MNREVRSVQHGKCTTTGLPSRFCTCIACNPQPEEKEKVKAPFYVAVRTEGHLINAWMEPTKGVIAEGKALGATPQEYAPILIGSIARAACDAAGGKDGPLFKAWTEVLMLSVKVMCTELFGVSGEFEQTEAELEPQGNA